MEGQIKRRPGAQPGNRNAVKHGFYSRQLNKADLLEYINSAGIQGIEEELKLIHLKLKDIACGGNTADFPSLLKALAAVEKLLFVGREITAARNQRLKEAIETVMKGVFVPVSGGKEEGTES